MLINCPNQLSSLSFCKRKNKVKILVFNYKHALSDFGRALGSDFGVSKINIFPINSDLMSFIVTESKMLSL